MGKLGTVTEFPENTVTVPGFLPVGRRTQAACRRPPAPSRDGRLSREELRRIGFPWSEALVRRSRTSVAGTLFAAREALLRGAGFCIFNDVAVAIRRLQREVFTFSIHGRNNWPFEKETGTLDIALDDRTGDGVYLEHLDRALEEIFSGFRPELVFYNAGVDPLANDRLGRLALTHRGLRERDRRVLSRSRAAGVGVAICFGGGYTEPIGDIVEAHANTFRVAEALFPG